MASIIDTADALVVHSSSRAAMGTMTLQKLCYLAQGLHLALRTEPLFPVPLNAWMSGPASAELRAACGESYVIESGQLGDARRLSNSELLVVQNIATRYGSMNGMVMAEMTKTQLPWLSARSKATQTDPFPELSHDDMRMFFRAWLDAPQTSVEYANRFADGYAERMNL